MCQALLSMLPIPNLLRHFAQRRFRWMIFTLVCTSAVTTCVNGQETNPLGTRVTREGEGVNADLTTPPISNNIELVSQLLHKQLKKDGRAAGTVDDVAFDLETEHLALLVASHGGTTESKRFALIPFIPGDQLVQFDWENKLTLQTRPRSAARAEVAELYRDLKQVLYWVDFEKKRREDSKIPFDEKEFALTFYSDLEELPVVDMEGSLVGRIVDVAIKNSNGEIRYLVVTSNENDRRAIPLGAFISGEGKTSWSIELPKDQILNFKPFQDKAIPIRVDRGWEEYVAVRYGRGGLQTSKKFE